MERVHLRLDGTWGACHATRRACPRIGHQTMSLVEAQLIPAAFTEALVAGIAATPPSMRMMMSARRDMDMWLDGNGHPHRDYGLPAVTTADGFRAWYRHGFLHRVGLPAVVNPTGQQSWALTRMREGDRICRETFYFSDTEQFWEHGTQLLPA